MTDGELSRLLLIEIARHLDALERGDGVEARRALHALKGSLGVAGERALAQELGRIERRLAGGDDTAAREAGSLMRRAQERLLAGESASDSLLAWPVPPPSLSAKPIDPSLRAQYVAEVSDRLAHIDEALHGALEPTAAATLAYRQVHTIKGAASAVSDEPMAWFCHGLEERIRGGAADADAAARALAEIGKVRTLLGALLEDPATTLQSLRGRSPSGFPDEPRAPLERDTIRVAAQAVDRLIERTTTVAGAREAMAQVRTLMLQRGAELRAMRAELAEALRLIGPPRPWGAPAAALARIRSVQNALTLASEHMEATATNVHGPEVALREAETASKRELATMRHTPLRQLFARLAGAVQAEARRADREVRVVEEGGNETVDRRIGDALLEPCLQLARNAVAHGIESAAVRLARAKPPAGTIRFTAERTAGRLRVTISDDGAGVDTQNLRRRAIDAGVLTRAIARRTDDATLLSLLFVPGFTTRDASDLLAGRGIGLDIALGAVQKLGGRIQLASRKGEGLSATVEVPLESGLARVLWVRAGADRYALLASDVEGVASAGPAPAPHLATCVGEGVVPAGAIEVSVAGARVSIDEVLGLEEQLVRPLTRFVAGLGPYAGAIVRGDGSVRLALDAHALAARAVALAADTRDTSYTPRSAP